MPPNACEQRPDAPASVGDVVLRAMAKDPSDRPQATGEFARMLRAAAGV